jgi:hypothetical protein
MLDKQKVPLSPEDVVALLKECDAAGDFEGVFVPAGKVRELLTVWLRVAALYEQVEQNPTDFFPEMRCAVEALLLGQCEHLAPDTEPHHDKPSEPSQGPFIKCTCGFHGLATEDFGCPHCGEFVQ